MRRHHAASWAATCDACPFRFVLLGCAMLYALMTATFQHEQLLLSTSHQIDPQHGLTHVAGPTTTTESPSQPMAGCDQDFSIQTKILLDNIRVSAATREPLPKVLCFIMTHSKNHDTRVKDVLSTWGKRCDKLVLASDVEDAAWGTIATHSKATWKNLWPKLNETLHHVYENYRDDYDWFLKVDDDSYVIMENLKAFLASDKVKEKARTKQPLVYGRRLGVPMQSLIRKLQDHDFLHRLWQRHNYTKTSHFVFNSGGAGYVMNRAYLDQLILQLDGSPDNAPKGVAPEDVGQALATLYHSTNTVPQNTRDNRGRERFHFSHPNAMYVMDHPAKSWVYRVHQNLGGLSKGLDCCSEDTISFHYLDRFPGYMQYVEQQLYACRA
jgi:glycoprotein-N-acetylgalactosamine 3-beta-galactosyltransferase